MPELMHFNIPGAFQSGLEAGRRNRLLGEQERSSNRLAELASQAYSTPPEQQSGLLSLMARESPEAAAAQKTQFQSDEDRQNRKLVNMVNYMLGATKSSNPATTQGAWNSVRPELAKMFPGAAYGEQWTPEYEQALHQFAAQLGAGSGGQQRNMVVSPGSAVVDPATGNVVYERPFAPANGNIVKVPDGQGGTIDMVWDPRTRQLSNLPVPGQAGPASQAGTWAQPGESYQTPEGIVRIEPGIDPAHMEAVQADIVGGGKSDNLTLPTRDVSPSQFHGGGGLGYTPPKQSERDTFVTMSADEVTAAGLPPGTVAQRNVATGKIEIAPTSVQPGAGQPNKPMPVTALKLLQESREALSVSSGIDSELGTIYNDLQSGRLTLGPMANWIARGRNATGLSTDESRRFQGMMNTFEKMRNDSLRLNKGVQTEGDAQRAWNELFGNLSDSRNVMTQLERIRRLNERAILLHQENMEEVEANYGRREPVSAPQVGAGNDDRRRALLEKY